MKAKLSATIAVLIFVVMFGSQTVKGKAWRGIVPLHSTRGDVEKLLGPPTLEDSGYDIDGDQVQITYSGRGCEEGLPGGWSVAPSTVVNISVVPHKNLVLDDVLVPGKDYQKIYGSDPVKVDYVDAQDGVRFTTSEDSVQKISYFGSEADDKKFRCGEYKYAGPVPSVAKNRFEQNPFDSYGKIPFDDAQARLDSFMNQLRNLNEGASHYRGFIIIYAGRSAVAGEASTIAECSKNYLVGVRNAAPDAVIAVDGGYRDEFKVELYIMPNDAYPPLLMPTVSPKQVQILPGHLTPCPNRE